MNAFTPLLIYKIKSLIICSCYSQSTACFWNVINKGYGVLSCHAYMYKILATHVCACLLIFHPQRPNRPKNDNTRFTLVIKTIMHLINEINWKSAFMLYHFHHHKIHPQNFPHHLALKSLSLSQLTITTFNIIIRSTTHPTSRLFSANCCSYKSL